MAIRVGCLWEPSKFDRPGTRMMIDDWQQENEGPTQLENVGRVEYKAFVRSKPRYGVFCGIRVSIATRQVGYVEEAASISTEHEYLDFLGK